MTNAQKIMTAALAGAVVGLITGILVAPDKGSVTRQRIADTAGKVSDNVKEFANNASETIGGLKQKLFSKKHDGVFQGDEAAAG
jgi:gas vesicle protein